MPQCSHEQQAGGGAFSFARRVRTQDRSYCEVTGGAPSMRASWRNPRPLPEHSLMDARSWGIPSRAYQGASPENSQIAATIVGREESRNSLLVAALPRMRRVLTRQGWAGEKATFLSSLELRLFKSLERTDFKAP